ncbi:SDR family NAD(P)-dependent oxidoreductase [[Eubacterium] cellulosolvens]
MKLQNEVAIVTGGGRGIGKAIVNKLSQEGAAVMIADIEKLGSPETHYEDSELKGYHAALDLAESLKKSGRDAEAFNVDVTKKDQVTGMIQKIIERYKRIDILVNNAAIVNLGKVVDLKEDQWDVVMDVNAKGTFLCCQAVVPYMIKEKSGKIINISSESGLMGEPELAHYCASKWAVIGFTRSLALELGQFNINVNAVCPGTVYTQMQKYLTKSEDAFKEYVKRTLILGRPQTPEDIANAVLFLCFQDNITGHALNVTGGRVMS